jgi:hypothetical protein
MSQLGNMTVFEGDITTRTVDAIVNAATHSPLGERGQIQTQRRLITTKINKKARSLDRAFCKPSLRNQPHANLRCTISFLISPIALAGLSPFGQVLVQFMIVWQR